jgi:hypothetical protein
VQIIDFMGNPAAVFFSTYEALKDALPFHDHLAPVNHMLSASTAETVPYSFFPVQRINQPNHLGGVLDSCPD